MKNIVIIGSHTQFLTALGSLQFSNCNPQDTTFVFIRNYRNTYCDMPYDVVCMDELYSLSLLANKDWRARKKIISEIDSFIDTLCHEGVFSLYVPHVCVTFMQIFVTHPRCVKLNLIQEAAIAYKGRFRNTYNVDHFLSTIYNAFILRDRRSWRTKKWIIPSFLKKKLKNEIYAYEVSDVFRYSHDIQAKYRIQWPKVDISYSLNTNWPIIIFDGFVEMKCIELEVYCRIAGDMIKDISNCNCYVKFHPAQSEYTKNCLLQKFKECNIVVTEIESDVPFEFLISKYQGLEIYGFYSSLLEFAKVDDRHKVISYNEKLIKESSLYKNWFMSDR